MNPPEAPGEGDPDEPWSLLGDLSRLLRSPAVARQAADQLAAAVAADGKSEPNVPPTARTAFAELVPVARLAAEAATGLPVTSEHQSVEVAVVNRSGWAHLTLRDWRPHFQQLQEGLAKAREEPDDEPDLGGPEAMLGRLMEPLTPMLADITAATCTGRLARVALGSYDVMLPRVHGDRLLLTEPNIGAFAESWSLPRDDTCLWVCVHSLVAGAVLRVPAVHQRLGDLLAAHARSFEINPGGIAESLQAKLEGLDPTSAMAEMSDLLAGPEALLGATPTERQEQLTDQLENLLGVLVGYVDYDTERACAQLMGTRNPVREAFRRRRLTPPAEVRQPARLLGVDVSSAAVRRGRHFVDGVVERDGSEGVGRLWQSTDNWPTPNEVDAPGLWLARLDL